MEGLETHGQQPGERFRAPRPVFESGRAESAYVERTPAEERALFAAARAGDEDARQELVLSNYPLVIDSLRRQGEAYLYRGLTYRDLIQEGSVSLVQAVDNFDPDRGFRFSTYATTCIENGLRDAVRRARGITYAPKHDRRVRKVAAAEQAHPQADPEAIALATGLSEAEVAEVRQHRPEVVASLDQLTDEDAALSWKSVIADPNQLDPAEVVIDSLDRDRRLAELQELREADRGALLQLFDQAFILPDGRVVLHFEAAAKEQGVQSRELRSLTNRVMSRYAEEAAEVVVDGDDPGDLRDVLYSLWHSDHGQRFESVSDLARSIGINERRGRRLYQEAVAARQG